MYRFGIIVMTIAVSLFVGSAVAQSPQQDAQNAAPSTPPDVATQGAAPQNSAGDATHNMIGAWEFSNADHDKICHFNFRADAGPAATSSTSTRTARTCFPRPRTWSPGRSTITAVCACSMPAAMRWSSSPKSRAACIDGFTPEEGRYILQAAAAAPVLSADDMAGDWAVARGTGKPICMLTLGEQSHRSAMFWRSRSSPAAMPWSRASARPAGAWTKASWCCSRRAGRLGSSKRTTPIPGSACRNPPIRFCWCGSDRRKPFSEPLEQEK